MQIAQFVFGFALSIFYIFIVYNLPVPSTPDVQDGMTAGSASRNTTGYQYGQNSQRIHCVDSEKYCLVLLGGMFLAPLTYMFIRFFRKSYGTAGSVRIR